MKSTAYALLIGALLAGSVPAAGKEGMHGRKMGGERMKEKLGLTTEQAQKLGEARKARRETAQPLHEQLKKSLDKLKQQLEAKAGDGDVQATLDEIEKAREGLRAANQKFAADTKAILTSTQRARMLLAMRERLDKDGDEAGQ